MDINDREENYIPIKSKSSKLHDSPDTHTSQPEDYLNHNNGVEMTDHEPTKPKSLKIDISPDDSTITARCTINIFLSLASYHTCNTYLSNASQKGSSLLFEAIEDTDFDLVAPSVAGSGSNHYQCIVHNPLDRFN